MRVLVFQHLECEHPGSFRSLLNKANIHWDAINLHLGEAIPNLDDYDVLWVMGGPMDVWDVAEHPWLADEKRAIREWVAVKNKPYLGICLGHQLLADALGGTCGPMRSSEVGVVEVSLNEEGINDKLFAGMPRTQKFLEWHSVCVAQPPEDAVVLAHSANCQVEAMRIGTHAWSMQYHAEIEPDTVNNWGAIPDYKKALEDTLGVDGLSNMKTATDAEMESFLKSAECLFNNFFKSIPAGSISK